MSFNPQEIEAVWQKGRIIPKFDSGTWRWDVYGAVMKRNEYGNRQSKNGWEIDHIKPCASFDLSDPKEQKHCFFYKNLQPLWGEDNRTWRRGR